MKIMSDPFYLTKCYEDIQSNPGNMTKGIGKETLDKISMEWLQKTASELKTNNFKFSPARRVEIPKANSDKKRPLTIGTPREKIVQKGIQVILQAI